MSIVIGIINEKGVTISADTKLANIKIPKWIKKNISFSVRWT